MIFKKHRKNFTIYLSEDLKQLENHPIEIYINIFSLTDQLMKLPPYDQEKRNALRQQIINTEPLTEKEWLLGELKSQQSG